MNVEELKVKKAYEILKEYNGDNPYISQLKEEYINNKNKSILSITQARYVIDNHNFNIKILNKVVSISTYLAMELQNKLKLDFTPFKVKIIALVGTTEKAYHTIVQVSTKSDPTMLYLPKNMVFNDLFFELKEVNVNYDRYDNRLMERRGYKMMEHQKTGSDFLLQREGAILADEMGVAKALSINELAYTPNGKTRMGDINIGDYVIGSNGKKTKVIGVYPQGFKDMYRITFNDGYCIECCEDHLWHVSPPKKNINDKRVFILNTKQMLDIDGVVETKGIGHNKNKTYKMNTYYKAKNGNNRWQIPIVEPIEFENNNTLPIDPYLLGVSLGDGHFVKNSTKVHIKLLAEDYNDMLLKYNLTPLSCPNHLLNGSIDLTNSLNDLGLINTVSHTKFIPDIYKYSSIEDRISIMRGLMDTDGTAEMENLPKGNRKGGYKCASYTTTSERLVDDLAEIVHSLGGICRKTTGIGKYKKENGEVVICKKYYTLTIKFNNINPFKLNRKAILYQPPTKYMVSRSIAKIEKLGEEKEAICIKVDAEDSLFVANHAIVTHNTLTTIVAALETKFKKVLVICPSSVKINWKRELNTFTENVAIVNGMVWKESRFTIINYDILQNFHTLESKINKEDPPAYISRELVNAKFDLIIIDEAHNIRNKKSNRGEIVSELCTKFGKPRVWLLSGTPIANRPKDFYNLLKLIRSSVADDFNYYMKHYCDGKTFNKKLANGKVKKVWITNGASNLDELAERTKDVLLRRLKKEVTDMPEKQVIRLYQELSDSERREYDLVWDKYLLERQEQKKRGGVERGLVELILLRKFIALATVNSTYELAIEAIDAGKKVVIFTTFQEEQDRLAELFEGDCVLHNGSMTINNKQHSVDSFQENEKVKVFIGNVISAGVGITLTAGTVVIFNSFSWIPGDNEQAEDRIWRIGQKNDCLVYYQLFINTVSEKVLETLKDKKDMINQIIASQKEIDLYHEQIMDLILS